ncbi:MAG TPA: DUF4062 domain-containing protein [Thermoanaerobaculia bacterium]|nr:DUF4062 domain-containing protein [Thermoanaerobaculia bacterium]
MPTSVFLSSTSLDLREHRAEVHKALLDAGYHPVGMENFAAQPVEPTSASLGEVRTADVFVGIYAWRYGFVPEGSSVSITELEYDEARRLDRPCLCFVVDETAPWPEDFREKGSGADRLRALKVRLDRELTRTTFITPENLAIRVLASLQRWEKQHRHGPRTKEDLRGRRILLGRVRSFWIEGLLERAEEEMPLQALPKETDADMVAQPWQNVLETSRGSRNPLPANRAAFELFEDSGRALLILGAPGSGKTITLLELARDAARQADRDPGQPIPVIFNLSSWSGHHDRLFDWLIEELGTKYQIPNKIGRRWLKADDLLLLLDGLDDVPEKRRAACAEAINQLREEHGLTELAVTCRIGPYEALGVKLVLGSSVVLQPLAPEQVEALLSSGNTNTSLQRVLDEDPGLQELAQTPLLLAVMRRAYSELPVEELLAPQLAEPDARRRHLFTSYVDRMLQRRGGPLPYRRERFSRWLSWLAQGMGRANRSVFLLEELQPSWLERRFDIFLYSLISRLLLVLGFILVLVLGDGILALLMLSIVIAISMIDGVAMALLKERTKDGTNTRWSGLRNSLIFFTTICISLPFFYRDGPVFTALGALLAAFLTTILNMQKNQWGADKHIRRFEEMIWSWRKATVLTLAVLPLGLTLNFFIAFVDTVVERVFGGYSGYTSFPPKATWALMILLAMAVGGIGGFTEAVKEAKSSANQGTWLSVRSGLTVGLTALLLTLPLSFLWARSWAQQTGADFSSAALCSSVITGWFFLSRRGGRSFVSHFTIRFLLAVHGKLPWNATPFLDFAADRILLYKVGGGYVFIHRLLLEHFASLEPETPR